MTEKESSGTPAVNAPRLSRRGLTIMVVTLLISPIVLIGITWWTLPPISEKPLDAQVKFVDFVDVPAFQSMSAEQKREVHQSIRDETFLPAIEVTNHSDEEWTLMGVSLNGTFDFISRDPLPAGESRILYLHRFHTRQGDGFQPLDYPIKKIRVFARLPSYERAFYECQATRYGQIEEDDSH